jgi:hypothetical protein
MKKVLVSLVAGLTLMAGASAFAKDGGADGGSRTADLSAAHTKHAMEAHKAKHAAHVKKEAQPSAEKAVAVQK